MKIPLGKVTLTNRRTLQIAKTTIASQIFILTGTKNKILRIQTSLWLQQKNRNNGTKLTVLMFLQGKNKGNKESKGNLLRFKNRSIAQVYNRPMDWFHISHHMMLLIQVVTVVKTAMRA